MRYEASDLRGRGTRAPTRGSITGLLFLPLNIHNTKNALSHKRVLLASIADKFTFNHLKKQVIKGLAQKKQINF